MQTDLQDGFKINFIVPSGGFRIFLRGASTPNVLLFCKFFAEIFAFYIERQHQCCVIASDLALIKLLRFLNKLSESLQQWIATPIDQI